MFYARSSVEEYNATNVGVGGQIPPGVPNNVRRCGRAWLNAPEEPELTELLLILLAPYLRGGTLSLLFHLTNNVGVDIYSPPTAPLEGLSVSIEEDETVDAATLSA